MLNIKIEKTDKALSAHAGLLIFKELSKGLDVEKHIYEFMPRLKSGISKSLSKFQSLMFAFEAGADCLEDMDKLAEDEAFQAVCDDKVLSSKAYGDFLRSFSHLQCKQLNGGLTDLTYKMRSLLFGRQERMVVDIDSTINEQFAEKMEGVTWTYKQCTGLHTIHAFDENGFQLYTNVREGKSHTAQGAPEIIDHIFRRMPKTKDYKLTRRYVRADAGYSNIAFFNACALARASFVTALHPNMWKPLIGNVKHWHRVNPKKKAAIKFRDGRACEIGETVYKPDGSRNTLRVVVIRAVKKGLENILFKEQDSYEYRAFVTDIGQHEMKSEKLVAFYRARGHSENFIKELKYGLDLQHYPCLKLVANNAYAMIAAYAYNLMRFVAIKDNPKQPKFSKSIRFRFVHLPCQVVRHAKQVSFRFMNHHYQEVLRWLDFIKKLQLSFA